MTCHFRPKKKLFIWKRTHQILLLREVLNLKPYKHRISSPEIGQTWTRIAEILNSNKETQFDVTQRSCRERFCKIIQEFEKKNASELKASGIEADYGEYEQLCEDIKERMQECEKEIEKEKGKDELEKLKASEMRAAAMESLGQSKKRKQNEEEDGSSSGPGGSKRSARRRATDTLNYLKDSLEMKAKEKESENEIRLKELKIRETELQQQRKQQESQNLMI